MKMTDKEFMKLVDDVLDRFDVVYDQHSMRDFVEIVGSTGGDVYRMRVYRNGLVCEK